MQKKNKNNKVADLSQKEVVVDTFLRRIQLQDTILKKLLAEVDPNSTIDYEEITVDNEDLSIDNNDMPIEEKQ